MTITFVRPGESQANVLNVFNNVPPGLALTDSGIRQADELARTLKGSGIDAIFSSPLKRATETAAILAEQLGLTAEVDRNLIEFSVGELEGTGDPDGWLEYYRVRELWQAGLTDERVGGGESLTEMSARMQAFLTRVGSSGFKHVLAVGHGATLTATLSQILGGLDREKILRRGLGPTETVVCKQEGDGWVCTRWGVESAEIGAPVKSEHIPFS